MMDLGEDRRLEWAKHRFSILTYIAILTFFNTSNPQSIRNVGRLKNMFYTKISKDITVRKLASKPDDSKYLIYLSYLVYLCHIACKYHCWSKCKRGSRVKEIQSQFTRLCYNVKHSNTHSQEYVYQAIIASVWTVIIKWQRSKSPYLSGEYIIVKEVFKL